MEDSKGFEISYSKDGCTYKLESLEERTDLAGLIQFKPTKRRGVYCLGISDLEYGLVKNDSPEGWAEGHRLVLAIVSTIVVLFLERYPRRSAMFQGESRARNRLYRWAIHRALREFGHKVEVLGLARLEDGRMKLQAFAPNRDCEAYIVRRRPKEIHTESRVPQYDPRVESLQALSERLGNIRLELKALMVAIDASGP